MAAQIRKMVKENSLLAIQSKKETKKTVVVPKKIVKKAPVKKIVKPAIVLNKKKPIIKPKSAKISLLAKKLSSKLAQKKTAYTMPGSLVEGAPPSSSVLVSVSTNETQQLDETVQNNSTENNHTKLVDGSLNQVIDEV